LTLKEGYFLGSVDMGSKIFIRPSYSTLFDIIVNDWQNKKNTLVLGTTGIGKSTFLSYILYRLRQRNDGDVVLWGRGEAPRLYKNDGSVEEGTKLEDFPECNKPSTYLLTDGLNPPAYGIAAKILEVSSPRKEYWLSYQKRTNVTTRYMPVWSLEELEQCASLCYLTLSTNDVIRKFKKFGGSARFVLGKPDAEGEIAIADALTRTNVLEAIETDGKSGAPEDVSSIILHWAVKDIGNSCLCSLN
jgi:energy-coupling factor transporter ATP-binding protein EcfA2